MTQLSEDDIKKISRLARIEIAPDKIDEMAKQVGNIINWVDKLNEVNTDNVEPLTNVNNMVLRLNEDKVSEGNIAEDVLKNAPNSKYGYFAVPKVID
jgi:aspartyl-tRNA(Asn)/glutamyl-tRNA(Gln) amidotransferase subunit C